MGNELDLDGTVADPVNTGFRYWAFISYSHKDERQAARLHHQIEGYTAHARLSGTGRGHTEPLPKRLFPVFRDREELAGAPDLSERIQEALRESRFLIVVCSRQSAQSKWVDEEIKTFKRLGREERVLAFIIDGEPNASDQPNSAAEECFPEALRYRMGADGAVTSERTEPLAANARAGKDGQRYAVLKLIAGILGIRYDDLRRRDQERSARRRNWITAG
jgi:eukaryotic-like serine/threonine-protein kinase